jgi:hypothetical protein
MHEKRSMLPTRRTFVGHVSAAAACTVAGRLGSEVARAAGAASEDRTVRDRLWMWGHDAGSLQKGYGIGGPEDM